MTLFRPEATGFLEPAAAPIRARIPLALRLAALVAVASCAAGVAFLVMASYTSRVNAIGTVVPEAGIVTILAPGTGRVAWLVDAGAAVEPGNPLVELSIDQAASDGGQLAALQREALATRQAAQRQAAGEQDALFAQRLEYLQQQIAQQGRQIERARGMVETRRQALAAAEATAARFAELQRQGHVSQVQLASAQSDALDRAAQLAAVEGEAQEAERVRRQLLQEAEETRARRETLVTERERDEAIFTQENLAAARAHTLRVTSATAGQVAERPVFPGQMVVAGQRLVTVAPTGKLQVHLALSGRAVGLVREGARVHLRFQAFPYQRFGQYAGTIRHLARTPMLPSEIADIAGPGQTEAFRAVVELDQQFVEGQGQQHPLLIGMRAEATVLIETRRLYEWLFEPVLALRARMSAP